MATQQQAHVTLLHTSMVLPAVPTHPHHLFLPSLDLMWRTIHYNQRVLFYEACRLEDFASVVAALKESLPLALVHFFPWAGRLARGDGGRFVLDSNDAGVEFVEASIDFPFSDLVKTGFQFEPFFQDLAQWGHLSVSDQTDVPLLSVQVTKFQRGGIALAFSQNHVVADGSSMWHFMVSWGECARGIPISKLPLHERTALRLDHPSAEKAKLSIMASIFEGSGGGQEGPATQHAEKPATTSAAATATLDRVFHVSGEMARRLKAEAGEGRSSFEALAAHWWRCVMRARKLEGKGMAHIGVTVNCRKRLDPPLPENYFGNVVCFAAAFCKVQEISEETLGMTATRVHEAIASQATSEKVTASMHWLELHDNTFGAPEVDSVGVNVASSPRFPVYQVDFGWGPPISVRPIRVGGEGELCLFPGAEGGGSVDVCVRLEEKVMHSLEKDPLFLPFCAMDNSL